MAKPTPKNDETGLIVQDFAILQRSAEELHEVIAANMGNAAIDQGVLDRVKVPTGGGTMWSIPTYDGEVNTKELDGIIVAWKEPRAYWAQSFGSSGGGTPPDCSSEDSMTGVGNPGGSCDRCPMAQFGSAIGDDGKPRDGQACKQVRLMAIIRKDDLVPLLLTAPPTSLQNLRRYFLRLSSRAIPFYGVLTRFTLANTKSKGGVAHSVIEVNAVETLGDAELAKMASYAQIIGASLERRRSVSDDYHE